MLCYFLFFFTVLNFWIKFFRDLLAGCFCFSISITTSETGGDNLCCRGIDGRSGGNQQSWNNPNGVGRDFYCRSQVCATQGWCCWWLWHHFARIHGGLKNRHCKFWWGTTCGIFGWNYIDDPGWGLMGLVQSCDYDWMLSGYTLCDIQIPPPCFLKCQK